MPLEEVVKNMQDDPEVTEDQIASVIQEYNKDTFVAETTGVSKPRPIEIINEEEDKFHEDFLKFKAKIDKEEKEEKYEGTVIKGATTEDGELTLDLSENMENPPDTVTQKTVDGIPVNDVWIDNDGNEVMFHLPEVPIIEEKTEEEKIEEEQKEVEQTASEIEFQNIMNNAEKEFSKREKQKLDAPEDTSEQSTITKVGESVSGIIGGLFDADEWREITEYAEVIKYNFKFDMYGFWLEAQASHAELIDGFTGPYNTIADVTIAHHDGGETGWLSPEGEQHDNIPKEHADYQDAYTDSPMQWRQNLEKKGWQFVYKKDKKPVGWAYDAWLATKMKYVIVNRSLKAHVDARITTGFKEGDVSQLIGGSMIAVNGAVQTVLPALLTRGYSLIPQIAGPMWADYNLELAKAKYPELPEQEAMLKLLESNEQEMLTPALLSVAAITMEYIGFKGIRDYIKYMPIGSKRSFAKLLIVGNKEGFTEWGQLGTDIMNQEIPKLKTQYPELSSAEINAMATAIALTVMASEEGVERYLMGFVGGVFISGTGSVLRRALVRDKSSVKFITDKINEIAKEKVKIIEHQGNDRIVKNATKRIAELEQELKDFITNEGKLEGYLTEDEKFTLLNLIDVKNELLLEKAKIIEEHKKNPNSRAAKTSLELINNQIEGVDSHIMDVKNTANKRLVEEDIAVQRPTTEGKEDVEWHVLETEEQVEEYIVQQGLKGKKANSLRNADGSFRQGLDGKLHIVINKPVAINLGAVSVASHEVLHYITNGFLHDENGNLTIEAEEMLATFLAKLPKNTRLLIEARIENSYGDLKVNPAYKKLTPKEKKTTKIPKKIRMTKKELVTKDKNLKEEYLNIYIDLVIKGEVKPGVGLLKYLGSVLKNPMKDAGYENIDFNSASEVLTYLNDFIKERQAGKAGPKIKLDKSGNTIRQRMSLSIGDLKAQIDPLGKMSQEKWGVFKEVIRNGKKVKEWQGGKADGAFSYIYGLLDGIIKNKITPEMEMIPGFREDDFISSVYGYLLQHMRLFQTTNDSLWGWLMSQLQHKVDEVLKTGKAVTKEVYDVSLEDEGTFVNEIESEEFVDIDVEIENDVTFSQLRQILNLMRNGPFHKKIIKGIKTIIPVELSKLYTKVEKSKLNSLELIKTNLENRLEEATSPKLKNDLTNKLDKVNKKIEALIEEANRRIIEDETFKKAVLAYFKANFFDDIKKLIGGKPGSQEYKDFITNNAEALYNLFPQQVFNKMFQDFIIEEKQNISPTEVDNAIEAGLLPKDTPRTSGPSLFGKLPFTEEVKQKWIDNFLNPIKGRPASKQNSLIDLFSWWLGSDGLMEVINSEEFMAENDVAYSTVITIATKLDRGANVKFSNSSGGTTTIRSDKYSSSKFTSQFMKGRRFILDEDLINIDASLIIDKLRIEFPTMGREVIDLLGRMYDIKAIADASSYRFKQLIYKNPNIPKKVREQIKKDKNIRYNTRVKKNILKAAKKISKLVGFEVMEVMGYEWLGFISRVLDSAKNKRDGIEGEFYRELEALKAQIKKLKGKVKLPDGLSLEDIRLMNKKFPLFKKLEKILNNGTSTLNGSNLEWKLAEIKKKIAPEIEKAGEANIRLAKFMAKTLITAGIDQATLIHMLQIQTSIVSGWRALTTLDLITILEGSQDISETHPYFQSEYEAAKKAVHKTSNKKKGIKKGDKKFTTHEARVAEALYQLGTKGEHAEANANTMAALVDLDARYRNSLKIDYEGPTIDLDVELDKIFAGHGQIHGTKGTFNIMDDVGGTTNTEGWLRTQLIEERKKDMYGPNGEIADVVVANKEINKTINEETKARNDKNSRSQKLQEAESKILINAENPQGGSWFDFDWTVGVSDNYIYARKGGETVKISSYEYPSVEARLKREGWDLDFSDFNDVKNGRPGPLLQKMKNQIAKFGPNNVFILTARPHKAQKAIRDWLASEGVNIPLKNIITLADGSPQAKGDAILDFIIQGYNDIYFVDDHLGNVEEVADVVSKFDIKSKVVQAKIKTKNSLSTEFNDILEETEGIKSEAEVSDSQGKIRGSMFKSAWDWIFPASAYDLELFIYKMLGKGAKGIKQLEWFKKNLFEPFEEAYIQMNRSAQRVKEDYRALVKKMPKVRKMLSKKIPNSNLTYDQAIRIYLWNKVMGLDIKEIPGLTKRDLKAALAAVEGDQDVKTFAHALSSISGKKEGYIPPTKYWSIENIGYDLQFLGEINRAELLADWKDNVSKIFSEKNKNKLRLLYGNHYVEALEDMLYRMEHGKSKMGPGRIERNWANWVNNSVGAIMFFNMRSAVLQTISAINFVDWEDNTPFKAAQAFANFPQFVKDFTYIFNSDYLKQRRGKNARTLNENEISELTARMRNSQNKAKAAIAYLLEIGFMPTRIADSFAIASGGAAFYRNKVKRYLAEGFSLEEAEAKAWKDFVGRSEKAQQSSRPDLISQQQAGGLGRLILAFKNTPMQYNRIMIKAILDLKNNRGKTHANLSKIAYYGLVQNIIFTALQTALFAAYGDEDEWDEKTERVANQMIDNTLNGLGLTGAIAVAIKNTYLKYKKEKKRGWNADHTRTVIEFANISPTIGSKLRRLYSSIKTEQLNEDAIAEMGFTIENPAFAAWANLISAMTNIPVDRAVGKINNIILASKSETEVWDKVALLLGWNAWDLGLETESRKVGKEIKKRKKEEKKSFNFNKQTFNFQQKEKENIEKQKEEKKKGQKVTCSYNTSKGRCGMEVVEKGTRCTIHQVVEQREDNKQLQCKKIKSNSQQCGVMTTSKSGFCYYHD